MTKFGEVCKHGGLRRCCEICDLAEDLDKAEKEIEELKSILKKAVGHLKIVTSAKFPGRCLDEAIDFLNGRKE